MIEGKGGCKHIGVNGGFMYYHCHDLRHMNVQKENKKVGVIFSVMWFFSPVF